MAETCIVCLGDLVGLVDPSKPQAESSSTGEGSVTDARNSPRLRAAVHHDPETIAHLLPCKHNLHHECLKPWVQRANSCPICRRNFNQVELRAALEGELLHYCMLSIRVTKVFTTGPCVDSYAIQDKQQVAEIDPSMVVEHDLLYDEPVTEACLVCEGHGDEDVLLLCDGCNASCHTYCVGLRSVPVGSWFCQFCQEDGTAQDVTAAASTRPRTRHQQRRRNINNRRRNCSPSEWARVWQSVWDRLNIDLDFPFDDETDTPRDPAHQRDFEEWQRRFRVAERQGGAARFRDTASTLLDMRSARPRSPTPHPESQEEIRAWNAFDKAQELLVESDTTSPRPTRRKRKSPSPASAAESTMPAPERKLKRPRTRRVQSTQDGSTEAGPSNAHRPSMSASTPAPNVAPSGASTPRNKDTPGAAPGPSFLQSLLQEVEGSASSEQRGRSRLTISTHTPNGRHSPARSVSPASSPRTSPPASPRLSSLSPLHSPRSTSPPPLTSRIEPIFSQQTSLALSPTSVPIRRKSSEEPSDSAEGAANSE